MDRLNKEHRSWNMAQIRSRGTAPERLVRSLVHRLGYRFRTDSGRTLPGKPDIVLRRHRVVILVHGCFWHRHSICGLAYMPKSRVAFWSRKFAANVERDRRVERELRAGGWRVVKVWECETAAPQRLQRRLGRLLGKDRDLVGKRDEEAA